MAVTDNFLSPESAAQLRGEFDRRFEEPRTTKADRFVWDYWHVPDQYTLIRTSAEEFFSPEDYAALIEALTSHGQRTLGCNAITQPWLSYYVDGCEQRLHTDSWHGPFAYVLSLTDWDNRAFSGGETFILNKQLLDYWRGFDPAVGLEESKLMTTVEPRFNRLAVFDPRFPHGVRPVRGTRDPRGARLVLHGWYTDVGVPFYEGGLKEEEATGPLNSALEPLYAELAECGRVVGVLNVQISVSGADGHVTELHALADTLVPDPLELVDEASVEEVRRGILSVVDAGLRSVQFPAAADRRDSTITVPFVFE